MAVTLWLPRSSIMSEWMYSHVGAMLPNSNTSGGLPISGILRTTVAIRPVCVVYSWQNSEDFEDSRILHGNQWAPA